MTDQGRMTVLFVTPWYPHAGNRVDGNFVREHARAAAMHDAVVVLHLLSGAPDRRILHDTDEGEWGSIDVYEVHLPRSILPKTTTLRLVAAGLRGWRRIARDGFVPDVIHAHVYAVAIPSLVLAAIGRCPVVLTEHSSGFATGQISRAGLALARFGLRRIDRVMPVSDALRAAMVQRGVDARYEIVPNAVDLRLFVPGESSSGASRRILYVGRLVEGKGLSTLFDALAGIRDPDVVLDVVGDGSLRPNLERLASDLGVLNRIVFHGSQPPERVAQMMRVAALLVLPSDPWEGLPCSVIEAQASGLPVVATDVGGVKEIVDPSWGILVPPGDPGHLAQGILSALSRFVGIDRQHIAEGAARFSRASVGRLLHAAYREVAST